MSKVLIIDSDLIEYTNGYAKELSKFYDVTVATAFNKTSKDISLFSCFFFFSNKMKRSLFYYIIRTLEYIIAYMRIVLFVKNRKIEIIHIQFSLIPVLDIFFFQLLKKYGLLIYTCHDVIPHIENKTTVFFNSYLYKIPDIIFVHGTDSLNELRMFYPNVSTKVKIIPHGFLFDKTTSSLTYTKMIDIRKKVFSFIGQIYNNKGLDRVLRYWLNKKIDEDNMLVIAGRLIESTSEIDKMLELIKNRSDVYIKLGYIESDLHDYLYEISDVVLLPYKHASMSGVFFSAAKHQCTILTTLVGCIPEYLRGCEESVFITENNDLLFQNKLDYLVNNLTKKELNEKGAVFSKFMKMNYSWENIVTQVKEVIEEVMND